MALNVEFLGRNREFLEFKFLGEGADLLTYWLTILFSPFGQVCGSPSLLHTDAYRGTIWEQFGYRYARTVW